MKIRAEIVEGPAALVGQARSEPGGLGMSGYGSIVAQGRALLRGAALAAGFLIAASPASATVTCDSTGARGTLDTSGNWTAGGVGSDYRVRCTADTDGDTVTGADLPSFPASADRLVVDVSGPNTDRFHARSSDAGVRRLVLTGNLASAAGNTVSIVITGFASGQAAAHSVLESFAAIEASGAGGDGIQFINEDASHTGTVEAINRGAITTSGVFGYGMDVRSPASSARAVNAGRIATGGDAGRGVFALVDTGSAGTASVTNQGTIATAGGVAQTSDGRFFIPSDGVRAVHNGDGDARASNAAGATVAVAGTGGRGVSAHADGDGSAVAENAGSVETRGRAYVYPTNTSWLGPFGVLALSRRGTATARNSMTGSVATHGVPGHGVAAITRGGGDATVENAGTVVTHATASIDTLPNTGGLEIGARGLYASSSRGDAAIVNERTGSVETRGARAFGALAQISNDGSGGSATATLRNRGRIATQGNNADGAIAFAPNGGTAANPNTVRAYNESGGSVTTMSAASGGLGAAILVAGGGRAFGSAFAQNDGTITTEGGRGGVQGTEPAWGLSASFFNNDGSVITDAGDVEARNTGSITVTGEAAQGIRAVTFGAGAATVLVDRGKVFATHDSTSDADDGVGIYATSGTAGSIAVTLRNNALIEAPQAMLLGDAPATVSVEDSAVTGRMSFGGSADRLTIDDSVVVGDIATGDGDDVIRAYGGVALTGDIDFGAGEDEMILDVTTPSRLIGNVTNLETLNKMCPADFVIDGDITFTGSSVVVSEGGLVLTGHMDVGADGTVEVHDGTRLTALLTGTGTPKITAGGGTTVSDGGAVVVEAAADAGTVDAAQSVVSFLEDANVQGEQPLPVQTRDDAGALTQLASFDPATRAATVTEGAAVGARPAEQYPEQSDVVPPPVPPGTDPGTGTGTGSGSGEGGDGRTSSFLIGGGAMLAVLFAMLHMDTEEPVSSASLTTALVQTVDRSSRYWVRSLAEALPERGAGAVSGTEIGMDLAVGNGFVLGFSATPDAAVEQAIAGVHATAFSGRRYTLKGGWQGETLFGGLSLSQADWRVASAYRNPTLGAGLKSRYAASQTDLRLGLGARFDLGAGLAVTPQAGAFAGEVKHEDHTAQGPVFRAAIPDVVQRYGGWRMGLGLSSDWQDGPGDLKLRPSLKISAARVWTDSPEFALRQSDRLGILSSTSRARLPGAPGTVLGLATGLDAAGPHGFSMGVRYGGLVMDGKLVHAAFGRAKISF